MEFIFIIAALVAVKHFCRFQPKTFSSAEIRQLSRSEYRANAKVRYW